MMEIYGTDTNIFVGLAEPPYDYFAATVNLDRHPGYWWVSRVFVAAQHRRQGWGAQMLRTALEIAADRPGPRRVVVCPGGYGTPAEVQHRFYRAQGFRFYKDGYMVVDLNEVTA